MSCKNRRQYNSVSTSVDGWFRIFELVRPFVISVHKKFVFLELSFMKAAVYTSYIRFENPGMYTRGKTAHDQSDKNSLRLSCVMFEYKKDIDTEIVLTWEKTCVLAGIPPGYFSVGISGWNHLDQSLAGSCLYDSPLWQFSQHYVGELYPAIHSQIDDNVSRQKILLFTWNF